MDKERT